MQWNWNHYLPDAAAGRDPLCDESEAYAKRLAEAGVPVDCKRYDGMLHAFFTLGQVFDDGRASVAYAAAALRRALA